VCNNVSFNRTNFNVEPVSFPTDIHSSPNKFSVKRQIKADGMSEECEANNEEQKCIQNFGRET
jgi:hypothetical protein